MDFKQEALWFIGVDRRRIVLLAFKSRKILHPSIIAEEVKRSIQNISHALHEMEERGFVESIDEKNTWHNYMLTKKGERILKEVEKLLGQ